MAIKTLKFIIIFLLLNTIFAFIKINPKKDFNENKYLNINFLQLQESLNQKEFFIEPEDSNKNYIVFFNENIEDLEINIYAKNSSAKINAIFIQAFLTNNTTKSTNPDNAPLNEKIIVRLKESLAKLPCNEDINFLKSGFVCENNYKVIYTINTDGLDKIRKWLGYKESKILLISILPV